MTECYKLIFDLSLYYTLSGFFTMLAFREKPAPLGFLLLAAAALADAGLRSGKRLRGRIVFLPLLLPLLILPTRPGLWQLLQLLPGWIYLGWSVITGRTDTDYYEFQSHFGFGLKLLLLLLTGALFGEKLPGALGAALPYLILMLADGVCLLRMLREQQRQGLRQAIYIGVFLVLCAGLTLGRAPQMLLNLVGLIYRNVLAPLLFCAAIAGAVLFYVIFLILKFLLSLRKGEPTAPELQIEGIAEQLGLEDAYRSYLADLSWLKIVGILLAAALAVFVLVLIFRRLMGSRRMANTAPDGSEQSERMIQTVGRKRSVGRIRPRDPRLAVRFYYAKYLAECRSRGLQFPDGMTAAELSEHSRQAFPGADPEQLAQVYAPARYSSRETVTRADAETAAALWRKLKQSRPNDPKKF